MKNKVSDFAIALDFNGKKKFTLDNPRRLYYFIKYICSHPNGCAYRNSYEGDSCLRNVTGRGRHRLRAPPGRTGRREHSGAGILKRLLQTVTDGS